MDQKCLQCLDLELAVAFPVQSFPELEVAIHLVTCFDASRKKVAGAFKFEICSIL